jgi:selenocysteine-specific elongation factor
MIVGTAGHVDHGKTALVRALTGVDTDRLKVEKERGITTELGFAPLSLEGGGQVSLVDVPGHERFVASMAAGAGGVDLALLVVALDEGVMPQTREHIDICALLGVRAGILVLTKADAALAASPERRAEVEAEVRSVARATVFADSPALCVSAKTGEGIEALRREIGAAVARLQARVDDGLFYLAVDRAFTLKGFGTVVTGTVASGQLSCDEEIVLLPDLTTRYRVRGLQDSGQAVTEVRAGQRAALNLVGLEVSAVSRGRVVVRPDTLVTSSRVDVELRCLPSTPDPLGPRDAFVCHAGTASAACRLLLLGERQLAPGGTAFGQLVLEQPMTLIAGQRFLLRGFRNIEGHGCTVAGGQVLQVEAPRRKPSAPHALAELRFDDLPRRLAALLREAGGAGASSDSLLRVAGTGRAAIATALDSLAKTGAIVRQADLWVHASKQATAPRASHAPVAAPAPAALTPLEAAVLAELVRGDLAPPNRAQLITRVRAEADASRVDRALDHLCVLGKAVRAADGLFFASERVQALRERLVTHLRSQGAITVADFKSLTGGSRRFAIPLSELFDKERLTLRVGDKRVLRERGR